MIPNTRKRSRAGLEGSDPVTAYHPSSSSSQSSTNAGPSWKPEEAVVVGSLNDSDNSIRQLGDQARQVRGTLTPPPTKERERKRRNVGKALDLQPITE